MHADTSEIERLTVQFKEWQASHHANYVSVANERDALHTQLTEQQSTYYRLNEHNNECEKLLDEASSLLGEIAKSGQVYRECTDKGSVTGQRIAAILASVAIFQPEPYQPECTDSELVKNDGWQMNPCRQGHRDVGAAGGVAHCYQCDEKIVASTTQEAFERWNATHAKGQSRPSTTSN